MRGHLYFDASDISSPLTSSVTFNEGETTKTISMVTVDDAIVETLENVNVTLSSPTGAVVAPAKPHPLASRHRIARSANPRKQSNGQPSNFSRGTP